MCCTYYILVESLVTKCPTIIEYNTTPTVTTISALFQPSVGCLYHVVVRAKNAISESELKGNNSIGCYECVCFVCICVCVLWI